MSDFRTRIPCREITSLSRLYDVLTSEYGNMHYKLETEKNEHGQLFWVVGVSCHFARDVRELLITKGVLRQPARPRGFTAVNGPKAHGNSLTEVIDLTVNDSDEETPPAYESTTPVRTRDLPPGSRRGLPDTEETPNYIAKSLQTNETQQSVGTRIAEQHGRAEQGPIATCNSAVGQEDRSTGRIPISMLLGEPHPRA
ncbi:hypothetical protein FPCIR_5550 [Fusarium pseudocircinatum]|uniref:Uncharacterized protein n=1 Tax=Fusarium pseudocircinatum TaxID=56676 RepID=A0A8H5PAB9_9HYPO|nr:hypothetical protein FPCIR_5550 [Fusarium pseudocircinatum]